MGGRGGEQAGELRGFTRQHGAGRPRVANLLPLRSDCSSCAPTSGLPDEPGDSIVRYGSSAESHSTILVQPSRTRYSTTLPRGLDRSLFQAMIAGDWIEDAQNSIIEGPPGVGKTSLTRRGLTRKRDSDWPRAAFCEEKGRVFRNLF